VYLDVKTLGIYNVEKTFPLAFAPIAWDEVVGMALDQQIRAISSDPGGEEEPANAHYSKLDSILITRLTGKTEWVKRASVVTSGQLKRGAGATFPIHEKSREWEIRIKGISNVSEFGGYAPSGEDLFLVAVDVEFKFTPVSIDLGPATTGSLRNLEARLETSPGRWSKPTSYAAGQLDTSVEVMPGAKLAGRLVFVRQRFERPFRLELIMPDGATLYVDVFNYDIGPRRGRR
jgi:hypothetical protein